MSFFSPQQPCLKISFRNGQNLGQPCQINKKNTKNDFLKTGHVPILNKSRGPEVCEKNSRISKKFQKNSSVKKF